MITVPSLEWHLSHACNLSCEGCIHLSDYTHNTVINIDILETWYLKWHTRIIPETICLSGGEPLLNKKILDILYMTREYWPNTKSIELTTNGFLLNRYPDLPKVLEKTQIGISISVHDRSKIYNEKVFEMKNILKEWSKSYKFYYNIVNDWEKGWNKIFPIVNNNIEPHADNNPESSWNLCPANQNCWQLFEGNIYKCPPLAYLNMHKEKYGLSKSWDPYLSYIPLTPDASDNEIKDFFNRKSENVCSMCSTKPRQLYEPKLDPIKRKTVKLISLKN